MRNLDQFIAEFREGFQPGARHRAFLFPPMKLVTDVLTPSLTGVTDVVTVTACMQWLARGILAENVRFPGRSLETMSHRMSGITEQFPYHTEYNQLDCSFMMPLLARDNGVPRFFNYWQNFIHAQHRGPEDGLNFRFPSDYYASLILATFDRQNYPTLIYKFEKVYPMRVESVNMTWDAQEFLKCPVTFMYSYWTILDRLSPEALAITAAAAAGQ